VGGPVTPNYESQPQLIERLRTASVRSARFASSDGMSTAQRIRADAFFELPTVRSEQRSRHFRAVRSYFVKMVAGARLPIACEPGSTQQLALAWTSVSPTPVGRNEQSPRLNIISNRAVQ
jgi:hypothetical protein